MRDPASMSSRNLVFTFYTNTYCMDLVWQPRTVISPDGDRGRHRGGAPGGAGRRSAAGAAAVGRVVVWIAAAVGVGVDGDRVVAGDGEASGDGILQSWRERERERV